MPILVLALNPSLDAEWRVPKVQWEQKNHVQSERRWAGGKGINVTRWLKHLGEPVRLLLPLGGVTGEELAADLRRERIAIRTVGLREATRVNVIVTTSAGRQLRFNPAGPRLRSREWAELLRTVRRELARSDLLVLSGSLPRGVPVNAYAVLIRLAHRLGVRTLLDCDGRPLAAAIRAGPFLVKPNEHELAEWSGVALRTEADVLRAARALSRRSGGWVLVSRSGRRSLLVNEREEFQRFVAPRKVKPRNTVGAGDAMLAAVARAVRSGSPPATWLARGLTVGTRATQLPAGQLPAR